MTGRVEYATLRAAFDKALPQLCANCESTDDLHIHHIVPLALGGRNRISNLTRLCLGCHSKAHGGKFALVEKSAETKRNNITKGRRLGSVVLFGYKYEDNRYLIDEEDAEVVRLIFRLRYKSEYSTINIATILNHLAITTAGSSKSWAHPVITRMLANPQYIGNCVYKGEDLGDGLYPAIIDGDLADSIQRFESKYVGKRLAPRNVADELDIAAYLRRRHNGE